EEEAGEHHRPRREEHEHPDGAREVLAGARAKLDDRSHRAHSAGTASGSPSGASDAASGSSSVWVSQSRPSSFLASALAYSCGPRTTVGITSKLWCGGGEGVSHSSVPTCHGFFSAFFPANTLWKKFTTKKSWNTASPKAAKLVHLLSSWRWE